MANFGTNGGNAGASENALALSGSDSNVIAKEGIALGLNASLNTGASIGGNNTGTINVGDPTLGKTFADTIKAVTEQNTTNLANLVNGQAQTRLPDANTDLDPSEDVTDLGALGLPKSLLIGGAVLVALIVVWLFTRK